MSKVCIPFALLALVSSWAVEVSWRLLNFTVPVFTGVIPAVVEMVALLLL